MSKEKRGRVTAQPRSRRQTTEARLTIKGRDKITLKTWNTSQGDKTSLL